MERTITDTGITELLSVFPLKMSDSTPDGQHSCLSSDIGIHTAAIPLYYNNI
ncbi:MAG: hypothetical protein IJ081_08170 [Prevotella sp.]|nr:hypothetical protein [Prevotella sp.]